VARLSKNAQIFLGRYAADHRVFIDAAAELQAYIAAAIADLPLPIHATTARAKRPTSLRSKCRRKGYTNPAVQVTDLLAVRIITYFKDHLDSVAARLRELLDVSQAKSRDTRKELAENEFGYRSVHLVARLRLQDAQTRPALGRRWFEVQVRSILDHAWSEIEHETIYKSGIRFSSEVRRRFKAIAASLEVLEDAFSALTAERDKLIQTYRSEYAAGQGLDQPFDVARLQAFLEFSWPHGLSWRTAEKTPAPFAHGSSTAAVEALAAASLHTARRLSSTTQSKEFRSALLRFAAIEGIAPEVASHLAVVVLAIAVTKPLLLRQQFPDIEFSPSVAAAVKLRS
jgi:ppGpp synthetase/RelA/SpoT-type nucleotidyltranferase